MAHLDVFVPRHPKEESYLAALPIAEKQAGSARDADYTTCLVNYLFRGTNLSSPLPLDQRSTNIANL